MTLCGILGISFRGKTSMLLDFGIYCMDLRDTGRIGAVYGRIHGTIECPGYGGLVDGRVERNLSRV